MFFFNGDFWIGGLFEILWTAWDPMKVREVGLRSSGMYRMAETGLSWSRHVFYPWNSRFHWQTLVINGDKTYGYFMVYQSRQSLDVAIYYTIRFGNKPFPSCLGSNWKLLKGPQHVWKSKIERCEKDSKYKICMAGGQGGLLDMLEDAMT